MKRLRHPIRAIREPFGTAGLIIACVALVAALGGSALAASGALSGKQKKEVEKIAKKFAGKPGSNGGAGPQGATGPAGKDGSNGAAGGSGTGVTSKTLASGNAKCPSGGSEFTSAGGATFACNGQTGFTATLPSEATETGAFSFGDSAVESTAFEGQLRGAISFPIPLAAEVQAVVVTPENAGTVAECPSEQEPSEAFEFPRAEPGFLCIYIGETEHLKSIAAHPVSPETQAAGFAGRTGAWLSFNAEVSGFASGTWAVTAE